MRTFISGGVNFYFLSPGEKVPEPDGGFIGAYAIWQREDDKWDVRWCRGSVKWQEITNQYFDTENEAFNFAYDHYGRKDDEGYRLAPTRNPDE